MQVSTDDAQLDRVLGWGSHVRDEEVFAAYQKPTQASISSSARRMPNVARSSG